MNYKSVEKSYFVLFLFLLFNFMSGSLLAEDSIEYKNGWEKYLTTGDTVGSLEVFAELFRKEPDKMKIASSYAQLLMQKGEYQQAARVLIQGFFLCEWEPCCEPALADLSYLTEYLTDLADLEKMLEKRLENLDASWIEISLLRNLLQKVYIAKEKFADAERLALADHYVDKWCVIGPFGNKNQQEFLVAGEIEKEFSSLDLQKEWVERGRVIRWQEVKVPWDGRINPGRILYPGDEINTYALTYINIAEDADTVFAVEECGASALWVNNELIYVDTAYVQGSNSLQRLIDIKLKKGVNQVVFKLAGGKGIMPQLRLRVVAGSVGLLGEPGTERLVQKNHENIKYSVTEASNAAYLESANNRRNYKFARMPEIKQGDIWGRSGALWGALAYYEPQTDSAEFSYENALALMNTGYLLDVYGFDSTDYTRKKYYTSLMIKKYPHCPLFLNTAAYIQAGDNQKLELFERALAANKDDVVAQEGIVNLFLNAGFKEQAWNKALEMLEKNVGKYTANSVLARIAQAEKWYPEAGLYFSRAVKNNPGSGWGYAREAINSTSAQHAVDILQQGRRRIFDVNLADALAGWLYKAQRFTESYEVYSKLLFLTKYNESYWDAAAATQVAQGDYVRAETILQDGISWMPQSAVLFERLGRILLRSGKRAEGIEYLKKSLLIQEDNPDLAAYITELAEDEEEFYAAGNIAFSELTGRDATPQMYPGFDQLILLDQRYTVVSDNATKKEMVHIVRKVLRESAVPDASVAGVYYDRERQKVDVKYARVIQPSGQINENPVIRDFQYNTGSDGAAAVYESAQVKSIQLSGVKEGSIVDILYTIEDTADNFYHNEFSQINYLGSQDPVKRLSYTVIVPEAFGLDYSLYKSKFKPEIEKLAGGKILYRVNLEDIAGIRAELRMPPLEEVLPSITFSSFKGWEELGHWADGIFAPAMELPADIREKVQEIVEGLETRDDKIRAIYNYVTRNIRYVSISYGRFGYTPHKAERTFRSGYGDCKDTAVLLAAMLKEVGIKAYPTLVRTRDRGPLISGLAAPELFNHSIAYVPAENENDKHYWLDGTTDYFLLGMIPAMDRGTESLIIKPQGELLKIDPLEPRQEEIISEITFTVEKGGKGEMVGREDYKGRSAIGLQVSFERSEQFFNSFKRFLNSRFTGADIGGFDYASTKDGSAESWFTYTVKSANIAFADGKSLKLFPWLFPFNLTNVTSLKNRNYDLMLGNPRIIRSVINIKLKDGLEIEQLPVDFTEKITGVTFERSSEKTPDGIRITTNMIVDTTRIKQADYQEFKKFVNYVSARADEVVFIK